MKELTAREKMMSSEKSIVQVTVPAGERCYLPWRCRYLDIVNDDERYLKWCRLFMVSLETQENETVYDTFKCRTCLTTSEPCDG